MTLSKEHLVALFYQQLSSCADGPRFGHNRHEPKITGRCAPLWGRGVWQVDSHLTQCGVGQGLPLYLVASWSSTRLASIDITSIMTVKSAVFCPLHNIRNIIRIREVYVIHYYNLSFTFVTHAAICSSVWLRSGQGMTGSRWEGVRQVFWSLWAYFIYFYLNIL